MSRQRRTWREAHRLKGDMRSLRNAALFCIRDYERRNLKAIPQWNDALAYARLHMPWRLYQAATRPLMTYCSAERAKVDAELFEKRL